MNIRVSVSLLLLLTIQACLAARLTDDQLEQILSEKIQNHVPESTEYVSLDEINELDTRLAGLEKLDDVTGRFYDDDNNVPEDGADKQQIEGRHLFDVRKEQDSDDRQFEFSLNLNDRDRLAGNRYWHFNGINHTAKEMTRPTDLDYITTNHKDGAIDSVGSNADYNICAQYSHTPSDLSNCLKLSRLRNIKWLDPRLNCVGKICNRAVNGIRKSKDKRNIFCSRGGCSKRKSKRTFCNRYGCGRSIRKALNASKLFMTRKNNSCNTVLGCRWVKRKVTNINKQTVEKKTELDNANIPYISTHPRNTYEKLHVIHMKPGNIAGNLESSYIDESADKRDNLRSLIGSLCISGRMFCLADKGEMKIVPRRNKNAFANARHLSPLSTEQYFNQRFTKQQTRQIIADGLSQTAADGFSKIEDKNRKLLHKQSIGESDPIFGNICGVNKSCHE